MSPSKPSPAIRELYSFGLELQGLSDEPAIEELVLLYALGRLLDEALRIHRVLNQYNLDRLEAQAQAQAQAKAKGVVS